jgi:hypothetical protein
MFTGGNVEHLLPDFVMKDTVKNSDEVSSLHIPLNISVQNLPR